MKRIAITGCQQAALVDFPDFDKPVGSNNIRGRTLVSLVSPGTELNHAFISTEQFPKYTGYASVFRADEVGTEVTGIEPGTVCFASGGHMEFQEVAAVAATPVPVGLAPEVAVFARLMGVSMTTLNTAAARPPTQVLVTGLGPVGNLAAQIFHRCGYAVTAVDPVASRREVAKLVGIPDVRAKLGDDAQDLKGRISLHVECSGHEQAVLDGCRLIRRKGEVVLVGVPWSRRADIQSFEILHAVFHNYVNLRSGWEWEIPRQEEMYKLHSIIENYRAAVKWLDEGSVQVGSLGSSYSPVDCQMVYSKLLDQTLATPAAIFDWRTL